MPVFLIEQEILFEDLSGQLQFFFGRELFVELFHIGIVHIVSMRCLVNAFDAVQIARDQFLTKEE